MEERKEDILVDENEVLEEAPEEPRQTIPFSEIMIGMVERAMAKVINDEEKLKKFAIEYESTTLPVLKQINFDEVLSRKFLASGGLTDNQILMIGFGWLGISTFLHIFPYLKKKKGGKNDDNKGRNETEGPNNAG